MSFRSLSQNLSICSLIKIIVGIVFSISLSLANALEKSPALRMTIQSCEHSGNHTEILACALMMHDSLCYTSVVKSGLDIDDDRNQCTLEANNTVFKGYLTSALKENTGNDPRQKQLYEVYKQWQHNVENIPPKSLEPEYQFKLRRDINSQQLMFKMMPIWVRNTNLEKHE